MSSAAFQDYFSPATSIVRAWTPSTARAAALTVIDCLSAIVSSVVNPNALMRAHRVTDTRLLRIQDTLAGNPAVKALLAAVAQLADRDHNDDISFDEFKGIHVRAVPSRLPRVFGATVIEGMFSPYARVRSKIWLAARVPLWLARMPHPARARR